MKKQIIGMMCLAAMMSSCHIYKAYDRPETIDASGVYRDPLRQPIHWLPIRPIWETCLGKRFSVMPNCRP